jgi:hypothetical protein
MSKNMTRDQMIKATREALAAAGLTEWKSLDDDCYTPGYCVYMHARRVTVSLNYVSDGVLTRDDVFRAYVEALDEAGIKCEISDNCIRVLVPLLR